MARPYIINVLDIGSGAIKMASVLKNPKEDSFEILGQAQDSSLGIRRGVVVEPLRVAETISNLVKKVEEESGKKINGIYASVGGGHLFSASSKGLVSVSRADQKISEEDIERVLQAAQTISLPSNKEILEVFPKEFIVDGQGGIKEAVGMDGVRLEADVLVLGGFSPYLKNSTKCVSSAGLHLNYLVPDLLASAKAVLGPKEKELGVCVLDIGAGTTGMTVFEEDSLVHAVVFPIGSSHITNDIAVCLKTDIDTAEKIKIGFGSCKKAERSEKKIKINGEDNLVFTKKMLSSIIEARVSEIFDLVNRELKKMPKRGLPAGVVVTGGGAKIPGIIDYAKKELKLPVRIGTSAFSDPSLSCLYGLALEAKDMEEDSGPSHSKGKGIFSVVKSAFKVFIP